MEVLSPKDAGTRILPTWLIRLCKRLWKFRSFFWGAIIWNLLIGIVAGLVVADPSSLRHSLFAFLINFPSLIIIILISSLSLIGFVGLISRIPEAIPSSTLNANEESKDSNLSLRTNLREQNLNAVLEKRYLQRMIRETEWLRLTGIPAGLVAQSVPLDYVFIPVEFLPKRLPTDYPLTGEEFANYRDLQKKDKVTEEMERIFFNAEKIWEDILKRGEKVSLAELWENLTRENPVGVIQGYPGMGKSTLMARLTLLFARWGTNHPDTVMNPLLSKSGSSPIPILIELKYYAIERAQSPANSDALTLMGYLEVISNQLHIEGLFSFLQHCLKNGRCLVMLDGLDEVSDPQMRLKVQEAIKAFILDHRDTSEQHFNRFLITSRVAGYDLLAFPDFPHYTIAELTTEQIQDFLPRWCRANLNRDHFPAEEAPNEQDEAIIRDADQMAQRLIIAIQTHQGVHRLAENPLLLTLLAVMQQNSIELPRQRVELYAAVTSTLLENRNIAKGLPEVPEKVAIERLGPIAFQMQATGNSFAHQQNVIKSLSDTIGQEGGTPNEITGEVEIFLRRIRERGGLFVIRTGDYFGFFHRTFQEYFAARYILNEIKQNPDHWISNIVELARHSDDQWREPFLLAVAYQSGNGKDETVARKMISTLLTYPADADFKSQTHDLLLAAQCLIETKSLTIGSSGRLLEKDIVERLLQTYEKAQRSQQFEISREIEEVICQWLLSLSKEAYRPTILVTLDEIIKGAQGLMLQRIALVLITLIIRQLTDSPPIVFDILIPTLLGLAGLPAAGKHQPSEITATSDLTVTELAMIILSLSGKQGPPGSLLGVVRQFFEDHPEHLQALAHYSLKSLTLLTFVVPPTSTGNFVQYENILESWIALRNRCRNQELTEHDLNECVGLHRALLNCAEEVCYPTTTYIVRMLESTSANSSPLWKEDWQNQMLDILAMTNYIDFQEIILLWATIFSSKEEIKMLVELILKNYYSDTEGLQSFAKRFIASLSSNLRDMLHLPDLREMRYIISFSSLKDIRDIRFLVNIINLQFIYFSRFIQEKQTLRKLLDVRNVADIRYLRETLYLINLQEMRTLRNMLLTKGVAEKTVEFLNAEMIADESPIYAIDSLAILMGRLLQITEENETSTTIENEIRKIAQTAVTCLTTATMDEQYQAALDIVRYLPARSIQEIRLIFQMAKTATDETLQEAYAEALRYATPKSSRAWATLKSGEKLNIEPIRKSIESLLSQKEQMLVSSL